VERKSAWRFIGSLSLLAVVAAGGPGRAGSRGLILWIVPLKIARVRAIGAAGEHMKPIPMTGRFAILTDNEGWFGSAAPEFQQAVLSRCEWREVKAGRPIYSASDVQTDACGIVDGTVEIYSRYGAGDNPMLHLSHEGSWIGYGAAVRGQPRRVTTVARTNVLLACVPWRAMQELLRVHAASHRRTELPAALPSRATVGSHHLG
jgi:hypothetical protein